MSTSPRRSSIRSSSSRFPSSLIPRLHRIPTPSSTSLSIVYADSTPLSRSSTSSSAGGSASEEALSRQLDGDHGGRTMGLRSRQGSNTTIRTARKTSGRGKSVAEEEEEIRAGPSTPRPIIDRLLDEGKDAGGLEGQVDGSSGENTGRGRGKLNPKASTSWLKWNSPAPSFPRSASISSDKKGKGKERQEQVEGVMTTSPKSTLLSPPLASVDSPSIDNATERGKEDQKGSEIGAGAGKRQKQGKRDSGAEREGETKVETIPPVPSVPPPPPAGSVRTRWWSRNTTTSATPAPIAPSDPPSPVSTVERSKPALTKDNTSASSPEPAPSPSIIAAIVQPALKSSSKPDPAIATDSAQPDRERNPATPSGAEDKTTAERDKDSSGEAAGTQDKTWRGYLWGSSRPALPPAPSEAPREPPLTDSASGGSPEPTPAVESSPPRRESAESGADDPSVSNKAGWGTYLYSFVATPTPPPAPVDPPTAHPVRPSSPTTDQRPVSPPTPPAVSVQAASPLPTSLSRPDTKAQDESNLSASPTPLQPGSQGSAGQQRKGSASSSTQSGWLNYLAFRANQKRVANASTASIKSGKERKSLDAEEVMDLSSDPNFPTTSSDTGTLSIKDGKGTTESKSQEKAKQTDSEKVKKDEPLNKKASQNLLIKNRRPSASSAHSANTTTNGAKTPLSSSPISKAKPRTPKSQTVSALPHPPAPPPVQPNFVIPSFDDTFDRPPRSLPPLPPPTTEGATGFAWRALGAAASYVYGSEGSAGETRGLKEGRRVGAGLPRKIGLGAGEKGEKPDDGWKHVKRVVVIGVHGWFPAKMLNSVIGEPTGTSVKFANMMGQAVKRFFDEKGMTDIRLTLMPLEGEGTIESRVDRLFKAYLSNPAWINDLRRADAVFFAAHSQGCIVTTHLISRLIAQGHIRTHLNKDAVSRCEWAFGPIGVVPDSPRRRGHTAPSGAEGGNQKVAMLAMCGVHLGPLYSISTSTVIHPYLQWFENAAARELFEFQDSTSAVSVGYQKAMSMVLENEVKMVLLASYNDQVVPIYGASFSTANHPLLLRALFVDGPSYSVSDFMTNLLCFAFMLRNAGIDDQRLVEHLSEATAGSLTGLGHSAPYEDAGCYDLTVKYLFLSGPAQRPLPPLSIEPFSAREPRNDFELPWIMRALVDSPEVKDLFPDELKDLKEGVVGWKPITKALKEIKKRLEPMAGRQSRLGATAENGVIGGEGASALRKDW